MSPARMSESGYGSPPARRHDGTTTGDDLLDQYGVSASPQSQGDSGTLPPFQRTLRRFALSPWAGARASAIGLVWCAQRAMRAPSAPRATGWVEFAGIGAPSRHGRDPVDWADMHRGTRSTMELSRALSLARRRRVGGRCPALARCDRALGSGRSDASFRGADGRACAPFHDREHGPGPAPAYSAGALRSRRMSTLTFFLRSDSFKDVLEMSGLTGMAI